METAKARMKVMLMLIILTPGLGQDVKVFPAGTVIARPGDNAEFTCYVTDRFDSMRWLLNGTYLNLLELEDVHSEYTAGLKTLHFSNLSLKYNSTEINCLGQSGHGRTVVSNQVTLIVMGGEGHSGIGIFIALVLIVTSVVMAYWFMGPGIHSNRIDLNGLKVDLNTANFIGRGAFGSVYKGTYKGLPVAVKLLDYHVRDLITGHALNQMADDATVISGAARGETTQKDVQKFQDECEQLSGLRHENVVSHIATLIDRSGFPILVMEQMEYSLKIYLKNRVGQKLSLDSQFSICTDICEGLAYLHQKQLVHRDLCADNVLLAALTGPDGPPKAKIADVGLSKLLCGDFSVTLSVITKREAYLAPEVFPEQDLGHYEYSLDMYAFGVVAAQIIEMNDEMHTKTDLAETLDKIPERHPMNDIVYKCLSEDRSSRPKAANAVDHLKLAHQLI